MQLHYWYQRQCPWPWPWPFCITLSSQDLDHHHAKIITISMTLPITLTTKTPERFPNCDVRAIVHSFNVPFEEFSSNHQDLSEHKVKSIKFSNPYNSIATKPWLVVTYQNCCVIGDVIKYSDSLLVRDLNLSDPGDNFHSMLSKWPCPCPKEIIIWVEWILEKVEHST